MRFEDQRDETASPKSSEQLSSITSQTEAGRPVGGEVQTHWTTHTWSREACCWSTACILNRANNRLQELMQLLYLLGRDPAIPQGARHHVTVAQSEIVLLSHLLQTGEQTPQKGLENPVARRTSE